MRLKDRVSIITGAGSGVGQATALRFAQEGANVVCADVKPEWLHQTLEIIKQANGSAVAFTCDVTKEAGLEQLVEFCISTYGKLDIMHNNVGITGMKPGCTTEDYTDQEWQQLLQVNVSSVFYGCKYAIRQFKKQGKGGVILNTGSVAGMVGFGSVLYGATKGAVNQMTKGIAIECAKHGIRVNAICPAAMPLTKFSSNGEEKPLDKNYVELIASIHPLGRYITAEDCAEAAVYLASDAAKNITGVLLPIDGGYVAQ